MRAVIILGVLVLAVSASVDKQTREEWEAYKSKHNLSFEEGEDAIRLQIYLFNLKMIDEHNAKHAKGDVGFRLGVNKFTHLLEEEVNDRMNGFNRPTRKTGVQRKMVPREKFTFVPQKGDLPNQVDWREKGAVTPVKDQGECGSCYAFSATGALEGQLFVKMGELVSLSEQNIIDCSVREGNSGCQGGWIDTCFQYVEDNNGTDTETSYPYRAEEGSCKYSNKTKGVTDSGYVDIPNDEDALKEAVATIGPISVAIDSGNAAFHHYTEGVYYSPTCSPLMIDHAVLVVGYGSTDNGTDYWLVKNSWGTIWGEEGYIKMARNRENNCGIASKASYPIVQ